ncbi:TPA: hypothetical protein U2D29_002292 [Streptococcus suis]|uniref:hypothetical protein n=1 Tax=Streptococcus suis TaxID=1307 RepID=UPI001555E1EB|nr:hypothetical protein [Streptococcus suis]NQL54704.1 hypothetical protein [Streptococcus suis]NQM23731.1 hypothetical protein [Streptococcus suis]HEM2541267.1 hypothetical protein [Streptococcus suis]HEM4067410.1 hypothetical protein [Streptococcus suis]HEM4274576.1 hypothetical protein [Streptococcus suis]
MKKVAILTVLELTFYECVGLYFLKIAWDKGAVTSDSLITLGFGLLFLNSIAIYSFYSYIKKRYRKINEEE